MKIILFSLVIFLTACEKHVFAQNSVKNNSIILEVSEIQELQEYYKRLEKIFKTNGILDSNISLEWKKIIQKVDDRCSVNIECVKDIAKQEEKEFVKKYLNFSSLQDKYLVPSVESNNDNCYENKALALIDSKNKTISFKQACRDNVLEYHILDYVLPNKDSVESFTWSMRASIYNDGEVDRKFTFMPAGVNKWVIITNGKRVVYIPHGRFKREVGLGSEYHIE